MVAPDLPPVVVGLSQQDISLVGLNRHQGSVPIRVLVLKLYQDQAQAYKGAWSSVSKELMMPFC